MLVSPVVIARTADGAPGPAPGPRTDRVGVASPCTKEADPAPCKARRGLCKDRGTTVDNETASLASREPKTRNNGDSAQSGGQGVVLLPALPPQPAHGRRAVPEHAPPGCRDAQGSRSAPRRRRDRVRAGHRFGDGGDPAEEPRG